MIKLLQTLTLVALLSTGSLSRADLPSEIPNTPGEADSRPILGLKRSGIFYLVALRNCLNFESSLLVRGVNEPRLSENRILSLRC